MKLMVLSTMASSLSVYGRIGIMIGFHCSALDGSHVESRTNRDWACLGVFEIARDYTPPADFCSPLGQQGQEFGHQW